MSIGPRYSCPPSAAPFGTRCTLADDLIAFRPRDLPAIAAAAASAASVVALRASLARLSAHEAERAGRQHA